ncbi:hypothetical protein FCL40_05145 [Ferrimonas sediminicola]|uniref:Haemolysin activator HlyB C-terminal domain-containing protein n=1 Tax=Ferrimonas sediminicola TaxID=2569538 RepID=A0A4U1BHL0_9GAMM|nr:ShlB/FhaC/HecB family hemolysin secretion/activation protein [Ferrimonas sediminicola]TKB50537.1 hypothetical protein FCL40_05145 [Ferrimonas sediminicola]
MKPCSLPTCILLLAIFSQWASAGQGSERDSTGSREHPCLPVRVETVQHNVFDPDESGFTWLHEWANKIHIITKPVTIDDQLQGFDLCGDPDALYEVERHLRDLGYLRNARVTMKEESADGNERVVLVETWDTWSLLPKFDFSRQGGESKFDIGIIESNLLGYGAHTELAYFSETDRNGYIFDLESGLFQGRHLTSRITLVDSDDGERTRLRIERPFYSVNTPWATYVDWDNETREDSVKQGGETINEFSVDIRAFLASWGWSRGLKGDYVLRYRLGYTYEDREFSPIPETTLLPDDRRRLQGWLQLEYLQDRFSEVYNLYLINKVEDVNFGITAWLRAGWDFEHQGLVLAGGFSRGHHLTDHSRWFYRMTVDSEPIDADSFRYLVNMRNELFVDMNGRWRWYNKLAAVASHNQYLDRPVALGGDTDMRGFPVQFQHGEHSLLMSNELRYYPGWTWYQILEVGCVAFWDLGKTYGGTVYQQENDELLQSVGLGLRLYASHSSNNVIHMDLSHPISDQPGVDNIEWRLQVRAYF